MFLTRLFSSVVLVIIALVTLLQGSYLLAAVLLFISLVAYNELSKACKIHTEGQYLNALEIMGAIGIFVYYGMVVFSESQAAQMLSVLFVLIGFMFVYVFTFPKYHAPQVMSAFFSFAYAPVMFSFIYQTRELKYGIYLVWMIFISSWVCDSCAYLTGMLIGKHKMTPKLSPKKSIEGAIGGMIGSFGRRAFRLFCRGKGCTRTEDYMGVCRNRCGGGNDIPDRGFGGLSHQKEL